MVAFGFFNAYAEGVVLSDSYVADDTSSDVATTEEPFVAPQTSNNYSGSEQIRPAVKNTLFNDLSGHHENGFSSTEFGGIYRMSNGLNNSAHIISDALFGLKLWGSSRVRTPEYADSTYYAGIRFGRQYAGVTLAGTIKSTWVFDDTRGLSYLDFAPEAYFRFQYDWRAGIGFDIRKSTNTHLLKNQEWLNLKLLRQYGNTQYVGRVDYEFEDNEFQFGADLKILF